MREIEMVNMAGEGAAEAAAPLRRAPRRMTAKQKRSVYGFVTAALPLVGYLVFNIVPLGIAIATMFVSMDGYDFGSMQWNNFQTFRDAFSDSRFLHSLGGEFPVHRAAPVRAGAHSLCPLGDRSLPCAAHHVRDA